MGVQAGRNTHKKLFLVPNTPDALERIRRVKEEA